MAEETPNAMNLDLNLGPLHEPGSGSVPGETVNLGDCVQEPVRGPREAARLRAWPRWRWRQVQTPPETRSISMELRELIVNSADGTALQTGDASVTAEERERSVTKACENNGNVLEDGETDKKDDVAKSNGNDGSFFDCNICFDLARDPVVTCCGHLFCWPCLYRWLQHYADAKECPVCKGEVSVKNVIPIYGRGNYICEPEDDSSCKVPDRPNARRAESSRQINHRITSSFPMEEMIRRLGSRFDLTRDLIQLQDSYAPRGAGGRPASLMDRILASRRMRREQNPVPPSDDSVDLTQHDTSGIETASARWLQSLLLRQSDMQRRAAQASISTAIDSAQSLLQYFQSRMLGIEQEQPPPVDDRDSFSSIVAVINPESQVDTAVEIDSMVSLSTSTSRRRNDVSRISDLDSGDSRASRRQRLN